MTNVDETVTVDPHLERGAELAADHCRRLRAHGVFTFDQPVESLAGDLFCPKCGDLVFEHGTACFCTLCEWSTAETWAECGSCGDVRRDFEEFTISADGKPSQGSIGICRECLDEQTTEESKC